MSTDPVPPTGRVEVAIVPTAPLLLPDVSPRQPQELTAPVAALRTAIAATLRSLPGGGPVVLLAGDATTQVVAAGRVDRTPSGHPQAAVDVAVDRGATGAIAAALDLPVLEPPILDGDLGVLAALVAAARPAATVVPITVAPDADLPAVAEVLRAQLADRGATLVAAGDLAATRDVTSPGYVVDGAVAFDDTVVEALRTGDLATLASLGVEEAARVQARGWAPVTVAAHVAARPLAGIELSAPRGVGLLIASTVATAVPAAS